ncbi:alpha/beta hydrolase [Nocardioides sp.]|uniref:alpha/beta fold hydrolase n=1 Tax=Nocardioides sp. TaxID=35761 RepID=UPI002F40D61E
MTRTPVTRDGPGLDHPDDGSIPGPKGHIARIVAGSLASGVVAALLLVAAPFIQVQENDITGAVLWGFAVGWAMLAVLSVRFTDQPQRWAVVPAVFMGVSGLLLVAFGSGVNDALHWVWPPALLALTVWMVVQAHGQLRSRSRWLLVYPVIAVMALASVSAGFETVREHRDASAYPMAGQLIDVGGHRLHLHCTGSGSPTVVLQPGGGDMSSAMGWIAPAVAGHTRVCVYDSAGRGWSDASDLTQDGAQMMTDLHALLHRGHVPGPYVLAGHSFGGLYVRIFAAQYPDEVAGMVLIDSTGAHSPASTSAQSWGPDDILARVSVLASTSARLGVGRLFGLGYGSLPEQSADEVSAKIATSTSLRSTIDEFLQASASEHEAASLTEFGDKPLVVLTAGSGSDAAWMAAQNQTVSLSTNSVHRVVDGASHPDLILKQADAAVTAQAINDVVTSVRTNQPLR